MPYADLDVAFLDEWMRKPEDLIILYPALSGLCGAPHKPDLIFWDAWDAGESVDDFFEAEVASELEALGWSAE